MLEKLKDLALRYEDLEAQLGNPAVYGDAEKLRRVNRELKELAPVVEAYRAFQAAENRRREAEELLHDPEMKEMAQEELAEAKAELETLKERLTILLLPKDPNDGRNVILEIRGGVGGRGECPVCPLAAADVRHVCRKPGLEAGNCQHQRNGTGRREGVLRRHRRRGRLVAAEV